MTASSAYCEQLGTKRQHLGKTGENTNLYILMRETMNLPKIPIISLFAHGDLFGICMVSVFIVTPV